MKKLFQICLVAVLILVLSLGVTGGSAFASGQLDQSASSLSAGDAHAAACLTNLSGAICFTPQVGWNS